MFIITLDDPNGAWRPSVQVYTGGGDDGWVTATDYILSKPEYAASARRITSLSAYQSLPPTILYQSDHPDNTDYYILDPRLKLEKGKAGSLEFTILPGHSCYDKLYRLRSIVRVYQKVGSYYYELQKCRVTEIEIDISKQKKITCQGDLAYLGDSIQPPRIGLNDKITPKAYFELLISNHVKADTGGIYLNLNYWSGRAKEFHIGKNQLPTNVSHSFKNTSYNTTESIIENLMSSYGGFLRTRPGGWLHAKDADGATLSVIIDGNIYTCYQEYRIIDFLKDRKVDGSGNIVPGSDEAEAKEISYGVNLVDLSVTWTSDEYFNTLVPTGDSVAGSKGSGSALPLTITGATGAPSHGGVYLTIGDVLNAHKGSGKDSGESDAYSNAIGRFTRIVRTENFSGIKDSTELLKKAQEFMLQNYTESPDTYTVTAVDNFELGTASKPILVGDLVKLNAKASHGIETTKECTSIQYDLTNPAATEFELGEKRKTLSDQFKDENKSSGGRGSSKSKSSASSDSSDGGASEQGNENTQAISENKQTITDKTSKSSLLGTIFGSGTGSVLDGLKGLISFDGGGITDFIKDGKIDIGKMLSKKADGKYVPTTALDSDPTLYPSVDVDKDGKIYIGKTWSSSGPNFFKIADTAAYKTMQESMRVSASDISLARRYDEDDEGQGSYASDYSSKDDGNVYLPATVKVDQNGQIITYLGRIEINESTYTPYISYEKEKSEDANKKLLARTKFVKVPIPTDVYVPTINLETIDNKKCYVAKTSFDGTVIGQSAPIEVEVSSSSVKPTDIKIEKKTQTISPTVTQVQYWVTGKINGTSDNLLQIPTAVYTPVQSSSKTESDGKQYLKVDASTNIAGNKITTSASYRTWLYSVEVASTSLTKALRSPHIRENVGDVEITIDAKWKILNANVYSGSLTIDVPEYLMMPRFAYSTTDKANYKYDASTHQYTITAYTGDYNNTPIEQLAKRNNVFRQASITTGTEAYNAGYSAGRATISLVKDEGPSFTSNSAGDQTLAELRRRYDHMLGSLKGMGKSGIITFKVKANDSVCWCRFDCS